MENPYQPGAFGTTHSPVGAPVSHQIVEVMAATRPWVRLCSVLGFVGSGFMILGGVSMLAVGVIGGMSGTGSAAAMGGPIFAGILYLALSLTYIIPAVKLWKFGSAIVRLMSSGSEGDLVQALQQQRGFWKFVGIMILVCFALMVLFMFFAVAAGFAAGFSSSVNPPRP